MLRAQDSGKPSNASSAKLVSQHTIQRASDDFMKVVILCGGQGSPLFELRYTHSDRVRDLLGIVSRFLNRPAQH